MSEARRRLMSEASTKIVDWLEAAPNLTDIKWMLKKQEAIKAWCLRQIDYTEGDRVEIVDISISPKSGWWAYRECLAIGATGTVGDIDFNPYADNNSGAWYASFKPDREWAHSDKMDLRWWHGPVADIPEGYEPPTKYDQEHHPDGRKHTFSMAVEWLRKLENRPK